MMMRMMSLVTGRMRTRMMMVLMTMMSRMARSVAAGRARMRTTAASVPVIYGGHR
jgi:hypothetical protein